MRIRLATRYLALGAVGLLTLVLCMASSWPSILRASEPASRMQVFGTRGEGWRSRAPSAKLDAALADLSYHRDRLRGLGMQDLHAFNPAARFKRSSIDAEPMVLIDAVTRGDPLALKAALVSLGLQGAALYSNDVGGWLPLRQLDAAAELNELHSIRAAMPRTRVGAVTSQGDFAQGSQQLRDANAGLNGTGVTVGILSDSFDCYGVYEKPGSGVPATGSNGYARDGFPVDAAQDIANGDLPANVRVLKEADNGDCMHYGAPLYLPFTDEGRAMLQIVHDVAPGAALAFYSAANSEADFAVGIKALAAAGATIEADDEGYFDEPFFQDGIVAQAIDAVKAQGVSYFSAAGNESQNSYEILAPTFTVAGSGATSGERLMNFTGQPGVASTTSLSVSVPSYRPGEFLAIIVEWDQPFVTGASNSGGATSRIDLCVTGATGTDQVRNIDGDVVSCTGANALGADPVQFLDVGVAASAAGNSSPTSVNITISLADGTAPPGRIKLLVADDGAGAAINPGYVTNSPTIQGHPGAAGALAVGAAFYFDTPLCGNSPATLETYSSRGGSPILFDSAGQRMATPEIRQKPEVVGPDGGNDTFLGIPLSGGALSTNINSCQTDIKFPNFFGTSAATPHVAAIAALMRQGNTGLTPDQIYGALESTAISMGGPAPPAAMNFDTGYGFVQALQALSPLPPPTPILTASPASISLGDSTTLTWVSPNTNSCTASGAWSGTLSSNGSQTVMPGAVGTDTYTLTCTNAQGSAASSVVLGVVAAAAPARSGGGGALDMFTLATLAAVWLARRARQISPHASAPSRHSAGLP